MTVNGDTTLETDETFTVDLSNPTNAVTISDAQGEGTIENDDAASYSIDDVTATRVTWNHDIYVHGHAGRSGGRRLERRLHDE